MEFTIDRSKWRCGGYRKNKRGKGIAISLLNEEGFMSCLGQTCSQMGVDNNELANTLAPCEIISVSKIEGVFVEKGARGWDDSKLSDGAMVINDDSNIDQKERESRLIALFKSHGHTIEFINETVK